MTGALPQVPVHVIIPALNEEKSLPSLLMTLGSFDVHTIVVDNGSHDDTAAIARQHGAAVVTEPRRGYGSACLAGLHAIENASGSDIVIFLDADGSDDPRILPDLIAALEHGNYDLVLASRTLVPSEPGALTWAQRFGNRLACGILTRVWGVHYTDLAPCRAVRLGVLRDLHMSDENFGWTVQMQVRAAQAQLRILEIPSRYRRRRFDESKISGRVGAGVKAGIVILTVIGRELFRKGRWRATDGRANSEANRL